MVLENQPGSPEYQAVGACESFGALLEYLRTLPPPPMIDNLLVCTPPAENDGLQEPLDPTKNLLACKAPDTRTGPQFVLPFRRPLWLCTVPTSAQQPTLTCVQVKPVNPIFAIDLRFEQTWNLTDLTIGDLSSTMSLAPFEQLTLEFQQSQRRLLEQSKVDSADEMTSNESTTVDKDALNVARSSSQSENWRVDGSGSFGMGSLRVGASGGYSKTITSSSQTSVQHITEATKKSAHNLKTLHKIEVRGVTEGIVQNRMTRVIKNPYPDRTISLNVFQLIKHFSVQSALTEIRPVLLIPVDSDDQLTFNSEFVLANADFLSTSLLDQSLIDNLPTALQGAKPLITSGSLTTARQTSRLALRYLFGTPGMPVTTPGGQMTDIGQQANIFHMPSTIGGAGHTDPNVPANSFNDSIHTADKNTGFEDSNENGMGVIFTTLNLFYRVYEEMLKYQEVVTQSDQTTLNNLDDQAVSLATALAGSVGSLWTTITADPKSAQQVQNILDNGDFTEIFRRLSGFLAIVSGMLQPLLQPAQLEKDALLAYEQAVFVLNQLLQHLNCNKHYYLQQFLSYTSRVTNNQAIIDLIDQVIASTASASNNLPLTIYQIFDIERSFLDKNIIVIPAYQPLTPDQVTTLSQIDEPEGPEFNCASITPAIIKDLEVPCDGIHLEVAPGACPLDPTPPLNTNSVALSLQGANVQIESQAY